MLKRRMLGMLYPNASRRVPRSWSKLPRHSGRLNTVARAVEPKENAPQLQALNYREGPRRTGIFLCLIGIMAGGVLGELLRESMVSDLHQHATFAAALGSPEVQEALAVKRFADSAQVNEVLDVNGKFIKDLCWENGRVVYFVLPDGSFFFDRPRPPAWAFSFVVLCPLVGFLIPWGIIKILSVMGVKYFEKPAPPA